MIETRSHLSHRREYSLSLVAFATSSLGQRTRYIHYYSVMYITVVFPLEDTKINAAYYYRSHLFWYSRRESNPQLPLRRGGLNFFNHLITFKMYSYVQCLEVTSYRKILNVTVCSKLQITFVLRVLFSVWFFTIPFYP